MLLSRSSVELLAPAGTWDAMEAAVDTGADAVYLGGKRFNMRMHRSDANFDDEKLVQAREYTKARGVKLYITVNNLISEAELPAMRTYLEFLGRLAPDSLIIQDLAVLRLVREMGLALPLHASVMMNIHNEAAVRTLQEQGITRVVFNREMTLDQLALLRQRTGIELEYFVHGDMCIAQSGQCLHSGVVFGQSSNRGRCLKPCRWPYQFVDNAGRQTFADPGPLKLAMNDMCLYLHLPQLIQAGVHSFKLEGRMRTAAFVGRMVGLYRRAIDRYIADPTGYIASDADWQNLYDNRVRDYTTCYAFGNPGADAVGFSGDREPRFFSQAVIEAGPTAPVALPPTRPAAERSEQTSTKLTVRVADLSSLEAAYQNGADIAYIGGEAFAPAKPWTLDGIATAIETAKKYDAALVVTTPRITMSRECGELEQFFTSLVKLGPHGVMVSNIGALRLARRLTNLPVHSDFSFSLFNSVATDWLKNEGVVKATVSLEASSRQILDLAASSSLPLETIVHGPLEAMVMDYCLPKALAADKSPTGLCRSNCSGGKYALIDSAGQQHPVKIDQYCRNHILFANDLCLLPHLAALHSGGVSHYRIEGQHYNPSHVGELTATYRRELDRLAAHPADPFDPTQLAAIIKNAPSQLGSGAFRFRASR
ncbi:MAG: U32 family peptidase [Negativicutes bacterium]|nr:U32 family peptidase [Negativicutes bacterium]